MHSIGRWAHYSIVFHYGLSMSDYPKGLGPDDPTAGDHAYTDHIPVSFALKEGPRGEPWVMIEEDPAGLPVLKFGDAFLGLQFRSDVPFAEAQRFTAEMRRMFDTLTYTKFTT
jgi:hypothetical protein